MTQQYQCWVATYRNFSRYITEIPDYPFYYRTIYNTQEMELNYMIIVMTHPSRYLPTIWFFTSEHSKQTYVSLSAFLVVGEHGIHTVDLPPNTLSPPSHCILKHMGGLETKLQELIFLNILLTDELVKLNNYNLCFSAFF